MEDKMPNEIHYDFTNLDDAIDKIKALKNELPLKAKTPNSYQWDYLYTGTSQGDVLSALVEIYSSTEKRSYQISELLDNVCKLLKDARKQMSDNDKKIGEGYKGE